MFHYLFYPSVLAEFWELKLNVRQEDAELREQASFKGARDQAVF